MSPEEKKLSASEHGRVDRVLFVSSAWSQLRGTWSLQNVASRVAFADSPPDVRSLLLATRAGYRVILSFPPVESLPRYTIGPLVEWGYVVAIGTIPIILRVEGIFWLREFAIISCDCGVVMLTACRINCVVVVVYTAVWVTELQFVMFWEGAYGC